MKRTLLIATTFVLATTGSVAAQQTATQLVRFRVIALQQVAVQELPKSVAPRAGEEAVATGSYGYASNDANRKISASLDQAMPHGSTLAVAMAAPAGGRSTGQATLGTDAVDLVTTIPASESSGLQVRYTVRASSVLRGVEQRIVTYTVTEAP